MSAGLQAYNNQEKNLVLILSRIIQQIRWRLIVCFATIFEDIENVKLYLRDVTHPYVK